MRVRIVLDLTEQEAAAVAANVKGVTLHTASGPLTLGQIIQKAVDEPSTDGIGKRAVFRSAASQALGGPDTD